ncbi:hypothetical protein P7C70_g2120, partial [Phenoliferia sp. Uapishka_3]
MSHPSSSTSQSSTPRYPTRQRHPNLSIAPATTPDINLSAHPPLLRPSEISAALSSASTSATSQDEEEQGEDGREEDKEMLRWGWTLLVGSTVCFVSGIWSIAVGPFIDTEGIWVLDAMAKDTHYKYLLILIVPVTLYAVIINWWGLKIFRHA